MAYTLTANYDNPPVAIMTLTSDTAFSTAYRCRFKIYSDNAGTQLVANSGWITPEEGSLTISYTFSSLPSGTYYVTAESDQPQTFVSLQEVVLADNTPKTATVTQWEDLATKVKAKATITTTTTDPGEGSALAENNFIAVLGSSSLVGTDDIEDGAVTNAKIADATIRSAKFGQYAVNVGIRTARDLSPAEDTPSSWATLLGASGLFLTQYSTVGCFTNQYSQYGELVTINTTSDMIQYWLQYNAIMRYRYGNRNGWQSNSDGSWLAVQTFLTTTNYTSSVTFSGVTPSTTGDYVFKVLRYGNVVSVEGLVTATTDISAGTAFMTLPSNARPVTGLRTTQSLRIIEYKTTGAVQCNLSLSSGDEVYLSATFIR